MADFSSSRSREIEECNQRDVRVRDERENAFFRLMVKYLAESAPRQFAKKFLRFTERFFAARHGEGTMVLIGVRCDYGYECLSSSEGGAWLSRAARFASEALGAPKVAKVAIEYRRVPMKDDI